MHQVTQTLAQSLVAKIEQNGGDSYEFDVDQLTRMVTLDVFGIAAFSTEFGCCRSLQLSNIARAFDFLGSDTSRRLNDPLMPLNFFYCIPTRLNLRNSQAHHTVRSFLADQVHGRMTSRQDDDNASDGTIKTKHSDIVTNVMEAHEVAKKELSYGGYDVSEQTLMDVMSALLFAGFDTTSVTLSYAFYLLSQHPEVEAACLQEIERSSAGGVDQLVYCKAVIRESLRLYPPGPFTGRTLEKPLTIPSSGFEVPAGTEVIVPIWSIHRSAKNFARPDEFLPERWVEYNKETSAWMERDPTKGEKAGKQNEIPAGNSNAFFAFSGGARNCPGAKFAWLESLIVFSGLLKEFHFSALPNYQIKAVRSGLVQKPQNGLPMKISVRNRK